MLLPIKPICNSKKVRRDGTSIIFIQYCVSATHRTNLNTGIAVPAAYWNAGKLCISPNLPLTYGDASSLNEQLKRVIRLAEDLIDLADKWEIQYKGCFVKEVFKSDLDLEAFSEDKEKLLTYSKTKEQALKLDIYYQLSEYIKVKKGRVSNTTISIYENLGQQLKDF